jgi:signal transduction histidine kinase
MSESRQLMQEYADRSLPRYRPRSVATASPAATAVASHDVQLYENEAFLCAAAADFAAVGFTTGQPTLIIATEPHRLAIARRLKAKGLDVARATRAGYLALLDARETLALFMVGSLPDPQRFHDAMGRILERHQNGESAPVVRVYGEMVDLLCKDGNAAAALRLERLLNELATTHAFALLCAYAVDDFQKAEHGDHFHSLCREHAHVVPTERYLAIDEDARLLEVSLLQQRARALEHEIAGRKDLERRLRTMAAERRRAEDALQRREEELKLALAERATLLEREQEAQAAVASANRAKNEFLTLMSHELRTPLNAIGGHVQLVEMELHGPVTSAQREALDRVQRSQRHLLALINDVLNLSRVESGRVEYVLEEIALAPLVQEAITLIQPLLLGAGLTCECVVGPSPSRTALIAKADREKVQQILLNLLTNALKFTAPGGRITVEVASGDTPSSAFIQVSDTGVGIDASKLATIFEPFVQLPSGHATRPYGVGLGLSISRQVARGMLGDLTAESVVGEGTAFRLTLPAV